MPNAVLRQATPTPGTLFCTQVARSLALTNQVTSRLYAQVSISQYDAYKTSLQFKVSKKSPTAPNPDLAAGERCGPLRHRMPCLDRPAACSSSRIPAVSIPGAGGARIPRMAHPTAPTHPYLLGALLLGALLLHLAAPTSFPSLRLSLHPTPPKTPSHPIPPDFDPPQPTPRTPCWPASLRSWRPTRWTTCCSPRWCAPACPPR